MAEPSPILGIDIGGSSVKLALLDAHDQSPLAVGQSQPYVKPDTAQLISAIRSAAAKLPMPAHLQSVGLCVPGLLDVQRRVITYAVNVPGLMGEQLDHLIAETLRGTSIGKVHLINDAQATATDVVRALRLTGRSLVIAMGTGIGAAIMDGVRWLRVEGESSGHFGQIDVSLDESPPIGPDGGAGSLEAYCGAAALRSAYPVDDDPTAIAFEKIRADDPPCRALARAIRLSHAIYRPQHIVLAGGIGIRLKPLRQALFEQISQHLTSVARKDWTLAVAIDDFHGARGAARVAMGIEAGAMT